MKKYFFALFGFLTYCNVNAGWEEIKQEIVERLNIANDLEEYLKPEGRVDRIINILEEYLKKDATPDSKKEMTRMLITALSLVMSFEESIHNALLLLNSYEGSLEKEKMNERTKILKEKNIFELKDAKNKKQTSSDYKRHEEKHEEFFRNGEFRGFHNDTIEELELIVRILEEKIQKRKDIMNHPKIQRCIELIKKIMEVLGLYHEGKSMKELKEIVQKSR